MKRVPKIVRLFAVIVLLALAACQGAHGPVREESPEPIPGDQSLEQVLSDLTALETPDGADPNAFGQLKAALIAQLRGSGVTKFSTRLPSPLRNQIDDLTLVDNGDGTAQLSWTYRNSGDYNLDGVVGVSDLTPLGAHLNKTIDSSSDPRVRLVDGDNNGQITIADLSPIGAGLGSIVTGYELFYLGDESAACWDSAGTVSASRGDQPNLPLITATVPYTGTEIYQVKPFNPAEAAQPIEYTPPVDPGPPPPPTTGGLRGVVTDENGEPVAGVAVQIESLGLSMTTDVAGNFMFYELDPADQVVIDFRHADFATGSLRPAVRAGVDVQADVVLLKRPNPIAVNAAAGGTVEGLMTSVKLTLPPNALVDSQGQPLTSNVDVQLTYIDPTDPQKLAAAPGDMSAQLLSGDEAQLESFGMAEVFINDGTGEAADLAEGQQAQLEYKIPPSQQATAPQTVGLFSFDEETGQWVEEGIAVKNLEGTAYLASVGHFSYWNCDLPLDYTCVKVRVINTGGAPLEGVRVSSAGVDYEGATSKYTDADGYAYFAVKPGATESIAAEFHGESVGPEEHLMPAENGRCSELQFEDIPLITTFTISYNANPVPYFTASPQAAQTPVNVTFDASASSDPDGTIVEYEWDWDGPEGPLGFESNGSAPVIQRLITTPGYSYPTLRVTDNQGKKASFNRYVCFK